MYLRPTAAFFKLLRQSKKILVTIANPAIIIEPANPKMVSKSPIQPTQPKPTHEPPSQPALSPLFRIPPLKVKKKYTQDSPKLAK